MYKLVEIPNLQNSSINIDLLQPIRKNQPIAHVPVQSCNWLSLHGGLILITMDSVDKGRV